MDGDSVADQGRLARTAYALGATLLLAAPLPILVQGMPAQDYDTSKRVSFAGTVPEQWLVAGDALPVLRQAGWRFGPAGQVKPGLSTSVSVHLPKPGSIAARTLGAKLRETMPAGISAVADAALKAGRLAQGVEVKLADGETLPFGPRK